MTVTTGGSIRFAGDSGVFNVGGNNGSTGGTATLNITARRHRRRHRRRTA